MKGSYIVSGLKAGIALIGSFVIAHLGGFDTHLMLLVTLIILDVVTGLLKALVNKDLASREMLVGMTRKVLILVCVCIGFEVNAALASYAAESGFNYEFDIRLFVILYFVLEELLSVLENIATIGVPMPKFIIQFLRVMVDTATNSTPNKIINLFTKFRKGDWAEISESVQQKEETDKLELDRVAGDVKHEDKVSGND